MLSGNEFLEPKFTIHGDPSILKNMVINIETIIDTEELSPYTRSKIQTVLLRGERFTFENSSVWFYKIYFSLGNQVGVLTFENLYRESGGWSRVNTIYVVEKDNHLFIEYYPVTSDNRQGRRISQVALNINDYFTEHHITKEQQPIYFEKFFNFYEPNIQEYTEDPLDKKFISEYQQKPLEQKMLYHIKSADIKQMDISDNEKEILMNYREHEATSIN